MEILKFKDEDALGTVHSVDTGSVIVVVGNLELLRKLQVNRLVAIQSTRAGQHLVGVVYKITRTTQSGPGTVAEDEIQTPELNTVRISLIGTFCSVIGKKTNVFMRTLEVVPEIDARCFAIEGDMLASFMQSIAPNREGSTKLSIGQYTLDDSAAAYISGDKFFQRHAVIVGSTGSGKSWATATILEQIADLKGANAVLFDIHGEYGSMTGKGFRHLKVAGPDEIRQGKTLKDGVLKLPVWLLTYEKLITMLVDRSDQNAPNQAMLLARTITEQKKEYLENLKKTEVLGSFTVDSPVPFNFRNVVKRLEELNLEMVPGVKGEKQGEFHGKLGRLIQRIESKASDRRLGFMFDDTGESLRYEWLHEMVGLLMSGTDQQKDSLGGIKVIDFSEVPSDILPLCVSMLTELMFSVQQWTEKPKRHPVTVFCDEAHLYIPERTAGGTIGEASLNTFERIAKEGRKYGLSLVVISQRPSEVNKTVLSQCNNFVAMRLLNLDDQNVVRRLLPDNLGGFTELLPILDVGEALVVGDASILPSRVRIKTPNSQPNSGTIDFWTSWEVSAKQDYFTASVEAIRRQSRTQES